MTWQALQMSGDAVAFTPDSTNLSITDNLDLRIRVARDDWFRLDDETFISKRQGGDEWIFRTDEVTGRLQFVWWDTGGVATSETADADVPFVNGQTGWIRVRRAGTAVNFWTSTTNTNDHTAVSWTALGTTQTTPSGSIRSTVSTFVTIGAAGTGRNSPLYGFVHAAAVVDNVTTRADPRFDLATEWTVGEDAGDTASDGVNTWTLGGNAEIVGDNFQGVHLALEAGFGSNPFDASMIWTDLTEDMRVADCTRGRSYELDRFDAGTMTTELENFSGNYHSHNTASPYYPNIKPMVPIRLRAVHDGTVYPIWAGFVERWPITYPQNIDSLANVESVDLFKPLSLAKVSTIGRVSIVEALDPVAWWRFGDNNDSSLAGTHDLTFAGSPSTGVAGAWPGDLATTFDGTDDTATIANDTDIELVNADRSFEVWYRISENAVSGESCTILDIDSASGIDPPLLRLRVTVANGNIGTGNQIVPVGANGEWHHVVVTYNAASHNENVYVNGELVGTVDTGTDAVVTYSSRIGRLATSSQQFFEGEISELVVYDQTLGRGDVADLYLASFDGYADQRTDERIAAILGNADVGIGAAITNTDLHEGQTTISGVNSPSDVSALEAVQLAADTERGQFFIAANGVPTFHDRHYRRFDQATPTAAIDQTDYVTLNLYGKDERFVFNQIFVSPSATADPFVVEDQTSIDEYGRRSYETTIYPADANEGLDHAHYLLGLYKQPQDRVASIEWEILEGITPIDIVLGAEIGNRYTITAPLAGDDLSVDVYLERITHTISGMEPTMQWFVTWEVSPATEEGALWLLGDAGFSELGETTVLSY